MKLSKRTLNIIYICSVVFVAFISVIWFFYGFFFTEEQLFEAYLFQSIITLVTSALATILLLYLAILYKTSTVAGKVWLLLAIGMLGWTIGEIFYIYYEMFTDIEPFPSIADLFYLLAYIPLSIGLILQLYIIKVELPNKEKIITAVIYIAICVLVIITVIILPILEIYPIPEEETLVYFIGFLYPIFDLILIFCVIIVFVKFRHGKINMAWILLLLGFLCDTIGDILFNWQEAVIGVEAMFEPFDLLYIIGYILIINSAFTMVHLLTKEFKIST